MTNDKSEACRKGGNGQCDGYDEDGTWCSCMCHEMDLVGDGITTVEQVKHLHDVWYRIAT